MTPIQLHRLAGAIATLRPDWPATSLQTFLEKHYRHRPARDIAVALTYVALDPDSVNPGRVLEAGPWWAAAATSDVPTAVNDCPRHTTGDVRVGLRIDTRTGATECAGCYADRLEDHQPVHFDRRPAPDEARALVRATRRPATPDTATGEQAPA